MRILQNNKDFTLIKSLLSIVVIFVTYFCQSPTVFAYSSMPESSSALAFNSTIHTDRSDAINNEENIIETDVVKESLLSEKINNEREANKNLFSLVQHNPNYLLPVSYSPGPNSIALDGIGTEKVDRFEAKYQISVKTPLWLQQDNVSGVYFGFTAVSFWQIYNDESSKPFRETNYQPEVFYQFNTDISLVGYDFNLFRIGLNHMSNGQSGLKSRSWNRVTATALFSDENTAYYLQTWIRLPEDTKESPLDPTGDDNPDINDYYGRVELGFGYRLGNLDLTTRIRNNLSFGDNRSAVELNVTYPFSARYDILLQLFNGYGDSLIDYNRHQQRISIGIQIRFL